MREAGISFARARGAHRHVQGQHQHVRAGRIGTAHEIESDCVVVSGEAVELEPEHIGRELGRPFNGDASDRAEHVGDARRLS